MKKAIILVVLTYGILFPLSKLWAQQGHQLSACQNPAFETKINELLSFDIPTIGVELLADKIKNNKNLLILDVRSPEEYNISHIPGAELATYHDFKASDYEAVDKDQEIVVYCSIGYRSEKAGEKLKAADFTNVLNLYGSIFEWGNQGYDLVDKNNKVTNTLHGYNKKWSQWVNSSDSVKVTW